MHKRKFPLRNVLRQVLFRLSDNEKLFIEPFMIPEFYIHFTFRNSYSSSEDFFISYSTKQLALKSSLQERLVFRSDKWWKRTMDGGTDGWDGADNKLGFIGKD